VPSPSDEWGSGPHPSSVPRMNASCWNPQAESETNPDWPSLGCPVFLDEHDSVRAALQLIWLFLV
jgi:hypothetical protein